MIIYYLMVEAVPLRNNPEIEKYKGAFVNCWVRAVSQMEALGKVKEYLKNVEKWMYVKTEDIFIAQREQYLDIPESLECYDDACEKGISAFFYIWSEDEE